MDVYIIGCGGNAKVVVDICICSGYNILGFFDDKNDKSYTYRGIKVIGKINDIMKYHNINLINSIGNCHCRQEINEKLNNCQCKINWINCIHPLSYIAPTVTMGHGNIVCFGAVINSDAKIGNFNLVNSCAIIEHDCIINDFNHCAPRSTLCGNVVLGNLNLLGVSASIIPGKNIGNNNIIGAMSVIIKDVRNDQTIVGVPGKNIKTLH